MQMGFFAGIDSAFFAAKARFGAAFSLSIHVKCAPKGRIKGFFGPSIRP